MVKLKVGLLIRIIFLFCGVFLAHLTQAQQDAQLTQYMYNGLFYNPAFAGKDAGFGFSALHRSQWMNYTGSNGPAPLTQVLSASGRVDKLKTGFGVTFVNDQIGVTKNQELNLSVAYHKRMRRGVLSLGAYGGMFSSTIRFDELNFVNPETQIPLAGDETQMNINFGAGAIYDRGNFYMGLSSRHINQPGFDFGDGAIDNTLNNHSYLLVGYRIKTFAQWTFDPSLWVKSVSFNNFSYDLSVIATHDQKISAGFAYRWQESLSVLLGYSLLSDNSLSLHYAFDAVMSGVKAKAPTSHEFMLRYRLMPSTREVKRVIQRTPRFRF